MIQTRLQYSTIQVTFSIPLDLHKSVTAMFTNKYNRSHSNCSLSSPSLKYYRRKECAQVHESFLSETLYTCQANEIFISTTALPIPIAKSMSSRVRTRLADGESGDMWNAGMSHTHPRVICKKGVSAFSSQNLLQADNLADEKSNTKFTICVKQNTRWVLRVVFFPWQRGKTPRPRCALLQAFMIRLRCRPA